MLELRGVETALWLTTLFVLLLCGVSLCVPHYASSP